MVEGLAFGVFFFRGFGGFVVRIESERGLASRVNRKAQKKDEKKGV